MCPCQLSTRHRCFLTPLVNAVLVLQERLWRRRAAYHIGHAAAAEGRRRLEAAAAKKEAAAKSTSSGRGSKAAKKEEAEQQLKEQHSITGKRLERHMRLAPHYMALPTALCSGFPRQVWIGACSCALASCC